MHSKSREFSSRHATVRGFHSKWIPGVIHRSGPVSYTVNLQDQKTIRTQYRPPSNLISSSHALPLKKEQEISPPGFESIENPTDLDQADTDSNSKVPAHPQRNRHLQKDSQTSIIDREKMCISYLECYLRSGQVTQCVHTY